MASSKLISFLVIIVITALQQVVESSDQQEVVAVYNSSDEVNSSCVQGADYKYNINDLPLNLSSNTLVKICSNLTLTKNISLSSLQKVTVVGHSSPVVKCSVGTEVGLVFTNIHNLELTDFTVDGCGVTTDLDSNPFRNIKASLIIQTSINITLENLNIVNGPGSGLAMFYNNGTVRVINSVFERNGLDNLTGGNGAYVETEPALSTDYMANGLVAEYEFTNCTFLYNTAATGKDNIIEGFSRFDKGGGLCLYILASEKLNITIANSEFVGNHAEHYGGGLFASFVGKSRNSTATVTNSQFIENRARYGGATYTGYMHAKPVRNNSVIIETPLNCSHLYSTVLFVSNDAEFGGGSSIFSTKTSGNDSSAEIAFQSCLWTLNTGQYGSAVAVLPNAWNLYGEGYLPSPRFINCTLQRNVVVSKNIKKVGEYRQNLKGSGAFYCFGHNILFEKVTSFLSNNGSAIYLGSCLGIFTVNSITLFQDNTGYQGGAIYELSSVIYIHDNATLHFLGNRATDKGGAIYEHTFFMHIYDYSRTCFIDYIDNIEDPAKRNISVSFTYNNASSGHSIYASSLRPCYNRFQFSAANLSFDIFDQVGNFTYYPPDRSLEVATAINHSNITDSSWQGHIAFVPGKETVIPFFDVDDLNQKTTTNYLVTISSDHMNTVKTSKYYSEISNNTLRLYGTAHSSATVTLSDTTSRQMALSFKVTMQPCPPGFIEDESLSCICALNTDSSYVGIESCNLTLMRAYQKRGYWIGYEQNLTESEDTLLSGYCSPGFCSNSYKHNLLPGSANRSVLNEMMCSESRRGILCGQCTENSSVHYHSLKFRCKADKHCSLGWLFYLLSVILPVTVIFLAVIIFNVPFTSGLVNGFIFYCQVVESLQITASGMIPISAAAEVVSKFHSVVYLSFSLDTFVLDELSFCLWKGANALATVAFNYVTLVYALLLVILLTVLMRSCNMRQHFSRFSQYMPLLANQSSFQGNIIHGLSAFLILCYAQCAHSSVLLLTSAKVFEKGSAPKRTVVYLNGEIEWMGPQHLPYAIPAIVLSFVIIILPPLLLLVYPLHYRVLATLRIAESRFSQIVFNPLEKLKPFFDSFQGCFKDEYRFFAGLYFVYRFFIMFNLVINYLENSFFVLEIQLILMLILHSTCQPYKQRLHNLIDTWLIGNLAIINAITYYNFTTATSETDDLAQSVTVWIQTVLIILPMPLMLLYLVRKLRIVRKCSLIVKKKNLPVNKTENEDLPARLNNYGSCDASPEFCN